MAETRTLEHACLLVLPLPFLCSHTCRQCYFYFLFLFPLMVWTSQVGKFSPLQYTRNTTIWARTSFWHKGCRKTVNLGPSRDNYINNPSLKFYVKKKNCFKFWPHHTACGILVPWQGIRPAPPAVRCRVLTTGRPVKSLCWKMKTPFAGMLCTNVPVAGPTLWPSSLPTSLKLQCKFLP